MFKSSKGGNPVY